MKGELITVKDLWFLTLMSPEKLEMVIPVFFRWKLTQRSSSSSGLSFIRCSRVSPSSSSAARAEHRQGGGILRQGGLQQKPASLCICLYIKILSRTTATVTGVQQNQMCNKKSLKENKSREIFTLPDNKLIVTLVPSLRLNFMSANSPILMICQRRPRTRWGLPSFRSWAPMLITWHPMAEAEFRAKFRFSCWYNV